MHARPAASLAAPAPALAAALLLLLSAGLAGCLGDPGSDAAADLDALEVYRFVYPGAEKVVPGASHGWLLRIHNNGTEAVQLQVGARGVLSADLGPATPEGWQDTPDAPAPRVGDGVVWGGDVELAPGASVAYLVMVHAYGEGPTALVLSSGGAVREVPVAVDRDQGPAGPPVQPGDHVQTVTVGVWANGTSFYTNSRSLLDDPDFPAGGNIDLATARTQTDPLSLYVYGQDRSEQPDGSRDTCHGTTIPGYNDLLKSQVAGSTGVRFLAPEEAYTRAGAEDHLLHGDALVFLNTVVAHDGATGPADALPDPQGACFDEDRYVPPVPPVQDAPTP